MIGIKNGSFDPVAANCLCETDMVFVHWCSARFILIVPAEDCNIPMCNNSYAVISITNVAYSEVEFNTQYVTVPTQGQIWSDLSVF